LTIFIAENSIYTWGTFDFDTVISKPSVLQLKIGEKPSVKLENSYDNSNSFHLLRNIRIPGKNSPKRIVSKDTTIYQNVFCCHSKNFLVIYFRNKENIFKFS